MTKSKAHFVALLLALTQFGIAHAAPRTLDDPDVRAQVPVQNPIGLTGDPTGLAAACVCNDPGSVQTTASANHGQCDTILLHSGQEVRDELDMYIAGIEPALDLLIQRRHTSRRALINYQNGESGAYPWDSSTFGNAWSFNYQRHLVRAFGDEYIREYGFDRVDDFYPVASTDRWEGIDGRVDRILWAGPTDPTPVLVRADGLKLVYSHFSTYSARLESIVTPNGNSIDIVYGVSSHDGTALSFRITGIVDSYGRTLTFHYNHSANALAVTAITDFDGRTVTYDYDSTGLHLVERSDPAGNTWLYEYAHHASGDELLEHSLTGITFPNQADITAPSADRARLQWEYYTQADVTAGAAPWCRGWVKTHTVGNQSQSLSVNVRAGGSFSYIYELPPTQNQTHNDPAIIVKVSDRRGSESSLEFNKLGQMLREEIQSDLRNPSAPQSKVRTFEYTADGLLVKATGALGDTVDLIYDSTTRASNANQTEQEYTVDAARANVSAQTIVTAKIEYEPVFNRPYKVTDPRGLQSGANAADYTTTYVYDYMEDIATALANMDQDLLPFSQSDTLQLLTSLGITSFGDVNGEGMPQEYAWNLVKIIHPNVVLPSQAAAIPIAQAQVAYELFRYNGRGQLKWHRDAEENVHLRTYYPSLPISGSPNPNVSGVGLDGQYNANWEGGYSRSVVVDVADSASTAARNSGFGTAQGAPVPAAAETLFLYTGNQGPIPSGGAYTRAVPTMIVDPRQITTRFDIDLLDDVVKVTRAAASGDSNLPDLPYETLIERDANRNIVKLEVQDADNLSGHTGYTSFEWEYNILDLETKSREDSTGSGARDATVLSYYDESTNLIKVTRLHDNVNNHSTTVWAYDERDIVMSRTDGFGTTSAATFTNTIDANGNVVSMTDADPGSDTQPDTAYVQYDGFDRMVSFTERDGTETKFTRDSIGNVLRREVYGKIERLTSTAGAVASNGEVLLSAKEFRYDTRNRPFQVDEELHFYANFDNGEVLDSGALNTQGGATGSEDGLVSSVLVRDRLGRVIVAVDADADEFIYRYDGRGNLIQLEDALQNKSIFVYDGNANLVQITEQERSSIMGSTVESFVQQATYDALNRLKTWIEPNQQPTAYEYDSRDNLKGRIDALGNHIDYRYDRLDRLVQVSQYLVAGGVSASASNFITNQGGDPARSTPATGGQDGVITTKSAWDDLHRLVSQTDDRGNVTAYTYDVLDRRTQIGFADGTFERAVYNGDGELLVAIDPSGMLDKSAQFDQVGRRLQETVTLGYVGAGVDVVGTTVRRWRYDGLGRVWGYTDNNDALGQTHNDTLVEFRYDSLGRRIWERQTVGTSTLPPTTVNYQEHSRVKAEVYPGGRRIERAYNALDRLTEVVDATTSTPSLLASRDYVGRGRLLRQTYGNGTVLDKRNIAGTGSISGAGAGFDSNGRTVRHEWKFGSQVVAGYVSAYNAVNRRTSETRTHFTGHVDSYTFDSAYRIIAFSRGGQSTVTSGVELDGVDKMFAFDDEGVPRVPVIDQHVQSQENGLNQYSSVDNQARRYDKNGGLNDGNPSTVPTQECRYDHLKRLTRVGTVSGSTFTQTHEYVYDAEGRRLAKLDSTNSNAILKRYLYDCGWRIVEERDNAGVIQREFVEGPGIDEHLMMVRSSGPAAGIYYYHCNEQGFVGALTNSLGVAVERYEYKWLGAVFAVDSTGNAISPSASVDAFGRNKDLGNPYQFQSRELDVETGYYQFRHRYYDPRIGEFTSIDPSGHWTHGQGNGYSAFGGDAWNLCDPDGLDGRAIAIGGATIGIVVSAPAWVPAIGAAAVAGLVGGLTWNLLKEPGTSEGTGPTTAPRPAGPRSGERGGPPQSTTSTPAPRIPGLDPKPPPGPVTFSPQPHEWAIALAVFLEVTRESGGEGGSSGGGSGSGGPRNTPGQGAGPGSSTGGAGSGAGGGAGGGGGRAAGDDDGTGNGDEDDPDVGGSGTRRNPDGSPKTPTDQLDEITRTQRCNPNAIESTEKSQQWLRYRLKRIRMEDIDEFLDI